LLANRTHPLIVGGGNNPLFDAIERENALPGTRNYVKLNMREESNKEVMKKRSSQADTFMTNHFCLSLPAFFFRYSLDRLVSG